MADKPEIKIGADLSAAEKAVDDLAKKVDEASKPMKVEVDTSGAEKKLDELAEKAEETADALGLPGAASGAKKLNEELARTVKLQDLLERQGRKVTEAQAKAAREQFNRWRDSGARGTRKLKGQSFEDFLDGGWRGTALNEADARRTRAQVLGAVGLGGGPGGGEKGPRGLGAYAGHILGQTGRGIAGQVMPGGVGGQIMQGSVSEAMGAGGLFTGAGMARLAAGGLVGAAAYGAAKLVGGVASHVDSAGQENVSRSDLIRSVGGTVDEFDRLRKSAEALGQGLSVSANEATSLARAYATGSGTAQGDRGRIYGEAGAAGGFARQTGLDVGSTVGQFAELRRGGQDAPEKLGKTIADAMSKRGDFGRLSDVLTNLTSFSSGVAGSTLTRGNTDNILDVASRLAQLQLPGMGTAEGIGHAAAMDAGFRGGAGGEAGDLHILTSLKRAGLQVNGYDVQSVREAGLMANLKDVFGQNSPGYMAAKARGDKGEMGRLDGISGSSQGTVLDAVYKGLKGRYGSNSQSLEAALRGITGGSDGDAKALIAALERGPAAGVSDQLKAMGIARPGMSVAQMAQASGVLHAGHDELEQRRADLLARKGKNALSPEDQKSLAGARGDDEVRKALAGIVSKDTIQTEGEELRSKVALVEQAVDNLANKLVGLLTPVREVLIKFATKAGLLSPDEADDMRGDPTLKLRRHVEESKAALQQAKDTPVIAAPGMRAGLPTMLKQHQAGIDSAQKKLDEDQAALDAELRKRPGAAADSGEAGPGTNRDVEVASLAAAPSKYDAMFAAAAKKYRIPVSELKLHAARESSMNADGYNKNTNGTEDFGLMGINSSNFKALGLTREDVRDPAKNIDAGARLLSEELARQKGNLWEADRHYNGGSSPAPAAAGYADHMEASRKLLSSMAGAAGAGDAKVDQRAEASRKQAQDATVTHEHSIVLKDEEGKERGRTDPFKTVTPWNGNPMPAGGLVPWS